jgi:uncharacterized protein (DUF1499 family)
MIYTIPWIGFFKGSETGDLHSDADVDTSPLPECPDSPNCIRCSRIVSSEPDRLFRATKKAIESMKPYRVEINSQSLQIDSVFRIVLFGFKDDLTIAVEPALGDSSGAVLHIRSAGRVGQGDLGVNRRRVQRLINKI